MQLGSAVCGLVPASKINAVPCTHSVHFPHGGRQRNRLKGFFRMEEAPASPIPDRQSAAGGTSVESCGSAPEPAASAPAAPDDSCERYHCPAVREWVAAGGRETGQVFEGEGPCYMPGDSFLGYDFDDWVRFHQKRARDGSHVAECFERNPQFRCIVAEASARPPLPPKLRPPSSRT